MSVISSLEYPVPLGKSEKNQLESNDGEIIQGRWVNKEEDFGKPVKWEKVKSWGVVVDRSLTQIKDSSSYNELAVLTKYENPNNEMPQIELLPIDSELFDTDEEPDASKIEEFTDVLNPTNPAKVSKLTTNKKEMKQSWLLMISSFVTISLINILFNPKGEVKR